MLQKEKKVVTVIVILLLIFSVSALVIFKLSESKNKNAPQININSSEVEQLNYDIKQMYEDAKSDKNTKISYTKYNNSSYLSIVFKIELYDQTFNNTVIFYTPYVISKTTNKVLSNADLLDIFGFSSSQIEDIVNDRLRSYYNDESKKGYIDKKTCDFECYKSEYREIENVLDIYSLSVEKNKLVIYFDLNTSPTIKDEKYFKTLNYNPNRLEIS